MNKPTTIYRSDFKYAGKKIYFNISRTDSGQLQVRAGGEFTGVRKNSVTRLMLLIMDRENLKKLSGQRKTPLEVAANYLLNNYSGIMNMIANDVRNAKDKDSIRRDVRNDLLQGPLAFCTNNAFETELDDSDCK